jgi:hypothetical protein
MNTSMPSEQALLLRHFVRLLNWRIAMFVLHGTTCWDLRMSYPPHHSIAPSRPCVKAMKVLTNGRSSSGYSPISTSTASLLCATTTASRAASRIIAILSALSPLADQDLPLRRAWLQAAFVPPSRAVIQHGKRLEARSVPGQAPCPGSKSSGERADHTRVRPSSGVLPVRDNRTGGAAALRVRKTR